MIEKELMGLWLNSLASKAPVPGGGGASAIGGALAAALGQMVANLTVGKKKYADVEKIMQELLGKLQALQEDFLDLADQDAKAFCASGSSLCPSGIHRGRKAGEGTHYGGKSSGCKPGTSSHDGEGC